MISFERLERLSWMLDAQWVIPGTSIRFGWDALLGLVPGLGDMFTACISCSIVWGAKILGVPPRLLCRMLWNIVIDWGVGVMPVIGDICDVGWKANLRNIELLRSHLHKEGVL